MCYFDFMSNLTKRDIVIRLSNETGIKQKEVLAVFQGALDIILEALAEDRKVELRNFGIFAAVVRKQRIGRNPKKPLNEVVIPEHKSVKFRSGKLLKKMFKPKIQKLA